MSKYVGGRIVPKHCGTWDSTKEYEVLSVVLYADTGDSYMARKAVPAGVDITDAEYWAKSADFSAQVNRLQKSVDDAAETTEVLKAQIAENVSASTDADADYAAELVDARVDDEGVVHDSLGEAVRERIGTLNDAIFSSKDVSYTNTGVNAASSKYFGLSKCKGFIKEHKELKLMRIYWDEQVKVIKTSDEDKEKGKRQPRYAEGNDAWKKLLIDTETSAIEVVVIYAARTVAPTISELRYVIRDYFIPCGIRFIDVEADFDTESGDVESYLKARNSDFRYTVKHKPHKEYRDRWRKTAWEDETE